MLFWLTALNSRSAARTLQRMQSIHNILSDTNRVSASGCRPLSASPHVMCVLFRSSWLRGRPMRIYQAVVQALEGLGVDVMFGGAGENDATLLLALKYSTK